MLEQAATTLLFYLFAAVAIVLAIAVTVSRRLLRAAVALMGVLLTNAALYVMLGADFLAGIQVLVYVGGITVVIAFAVMLTHSTPLQLDSPPRYRKVVAFLAAVAFAVLGGSAIAMSAFNVAHDAPGSADTTRAIGLALLDNGEGGYVLPFETVSVLLLVAAIGGIVVARKTPPPDQPFTSGGDRTGEADVRMPNTQRPSVARRDRA